jgi:hypothetical protein
VTAIKASLTFMSCDCDSPVEKQDAFYAVPMTKVTPALCCFTNQEEPRRQPAHFTFTLPQPPQQILFKRHPKTHCHQAADVPSTRNPLRTPPGFPSYLSPKQLPRRFLLPLVAILATPPQARAPPASAPEHQPSKFCLCKYSHGGQTALLGRQGHQALLLVLPFAPGDFVRVVDLLLVCRGHCERGRACRRIGVH